MNSVPLAPALGQGVRAQKQKVDAWPKIVAALQASPEPLTSAQLMAKTQLARNNLSVALCNHKALLVRTGARRPYLYRLRTAEDPA